MNLILILLGKLVLFASQTLSLGSGSTWPGHIAMETNPRFLNQILNKNKHLKIILVAGTNGKTTTSKLMKQMLEEAGLKTFQNEAGANLLNGMASTLIKNSNLIGKLNYDVAIFEVDENNLKLVLKEVKPHSILLLNIFRDQLDRYGEVNKIVKDWGEALKNVDSETILITNGDDPGLTYISQSAKLKAYYFGIDTKEMKHKGVSCDTDFNYCPKCETKLKYEKISFSHMGKFECPKCSFTNPETVVPNGLTYPLFGQYNNYNVNAAAVVAKNVFGISDGTINKAMQNFEPAFGRQEKIIYKNKEIIMLLSKNPAGFNQSIDAINGLNKKLNILLLLNDRIPDGQDVSWIWDVDFENLPKVKINIGGDRSYDMGLRIKYAGFKNIEIYEDLEQAIEKTIEQTELDETLFILPTYSAMLEAREILTGNKIL